MKKRFFLKASSMSLAAPFLGYAPYGRSHSQHLFQSRPVEFTYTVPPGSALDGFLRRGVDLVSGFLPHGAFFTNRPGANSLVGTRHVLKSDGNPKVLVSSTTPIVLNPLINNDLGYHPFEDFYHEFLLLRQPMFLVCNPQVAKNFKEFLQVAKQSKRIMKASSTGIGSLLHLQSLLIEKHFGLQVIHAPYTSNFILPVLSNEVDFTWLTANKAIVPLIETGRLVPILTTGSHRDPLYPSIPTLGEYIPGYQSNVFFGFSIPRSHDGHRISLKAAGVDWSFIHHQLMKEFSDQAFNFDTLKQTLNYESILKDEVKLWNEILNKYALRKHLKLER